MQRRILTTLAALAALYAIAAMWREKERAAGLDFYIFYVNAQLAGRADVANIYDRDEQSRLGEEFYERGRRSSSDLHQYDAKRRRFLDSVSSPFLYTCLSWVSRDYVRALKQFHALQLFAFVAGVLLLARRVRLSWASALFLLAALLFWYRGIEADLRVGNVNALQLFALGAGLASPPLLAGAIAGLLVSFKPNLILVPLLLGVARAAGRDWKRLRLETLGAALGVAIAIVTTAIHYRSFHVWLQWVARANEFYHRLQTRMERNVTPALPLFQEYGAVVSYALLLALTVIVCVVIWKTKERDDVLIAGLAILVYLLSATVVWLHYMVLVLPIALALLKRGRWTAVISLAALVVIAEEPYEWVTKLPVFPHDAKLIGPAMSALFVAAIASSILRPERPSDEPHPARAAA